MWEFTGAYDAITNEALCADLTCTAPAVALMVWWNANNCWANLLFNFYNRWIDSTGVHALSDEAHREGGKRSARTGYAR